MNDPRILLTVSDDDEDCRFCVGENTEISRVRIFRLYRVIALLDPIVSIISSRRDPSVAVSSAAGKVRSLARSAACWRRSWPDGTMHGIGEWPGVSASCVIIRSFVWLPRIDEQLMKFIEARINLLDLFVTRKCAIFLLIGFASTCRFFSVTLSMNNCRHLLSYCLSIQFLSVTYLFKLRIFFFTLTARNNARFFLGDL